MSEDSDCLSGDSKQQFDILLADYQSCREDDRSLATNVVTAFSIGVTLISVMAAAVTQTCQFSHTQSCVRVPDYLLAASPAVPIALLTYVTILGIGATLRSFYMRGLENKLQEYASSPILGDLLAPSYVGVTTELESLRRGRLSFRLIANLLFVAVVVIFGGYTAYIGLHVGGADQITMTVVYGITAIMLTWAVVQGTIRGRILFTQIAEQFLERPSKTSLPQPSRRIFVGHVDERSLGSYLLFPRPLDWVKWVITPGVFVAVAWSTSGFDRWLTFLELWFILEYLIYSARYQWNDVRGAIEDRLNGQRRLPIGHSSQQVKRNVLISLAVAVLRIIAALVLAVAFKATVTVVVLIVLVFGIAIVYETLRAAAPAYVSQESTILQAVCKRSIAVWYVVGLGYGVRAGLGFIVGGIPVTSWKFVVGIVMFVAFGSMFVAMTWVLGATEYCSVDSGGVWRWKPGTETKPHIALLLSYVPKLKGDLTPSLSESIDGASSVKATTSPGLLVPILLKYNAFRAPWNYAFLVSLILGGVLGAALARAHSMTVASLVVSLLSVLGACLLLTATSEKKPRWVRAKDEDPRLLSMIVVAVAVIIACVAPVLAPAPKAFIMLIPWLAVSLVYITFCRSSLQDIKDFQEQLLRWFGSLRRVKRTLPLLAHFIIGEKTYSALMPLPGLVSEAGTGAQAAPSGGQPASSEASDA